MIRIIYLLFYTSIIYTEIALASGSGDTLTPKSLLSESAKCMVHFKKYEKRYDIPVDLLHSIALQESGRYNAKLEKKIPWPWTVNVEGKGYYFDSKRQAVEFVKSEMKKGKKSIDLGCMQINILYHGDEFDSVEQAIDPKFNVEYGAYFLKEKYEQYGTWKKAIANYHSADPARGANYQKS
ncbi:MAG: lytic transglycosylase domain-containing protein, partial [Rickettsiaceae bacterium]|nr:lytic transglycosylase domain-containing protein [Rickettsiaceae bacterium]